MRINPHRLQHQPMQLSNVKATHHPTLVYLASLVVAGLIGWWLGDWASGLRWTLAAGLIIYKLDERWPAALALGLIAASGVSYYAASTSYLSEQLAEEAYYALMVAVFILLLRHWQLDRWLKLPAPLPGRAARTTPPPAHTPSPGSHRVAR